jgi:HK97 family phage prohead protease
MATQTPQPEREHWDGAVRRQVDFTVRAVDEERRAVDFVFSTNSIDSQGDVVEQFWDLDRYKRNPVILYGHNRVGFLGPFNQEATLPIGRGETVKVTGGGLVGTVVFATAEQNPMADKVFQLVKGGFINAGSVGFRPGRILREQMPDGRELFRLGSADAPNELWEFSIVPIPANPDAVRKHVEFEHQQLHRLAAVITETESKGTNMDPKELQAALDKAKAELAVAQSKATEADARVKTLELDVSKEKAAVAELDKQLKSATEKLELAETDLRAKFVDGIVGVYVYPAEKDDYVALTKQLGIERVKQLVEKRPKITITDGIKIDGKGLASQLPPPSVDHSGDNSDIAAEINRRATAA